MKKEDILAADIVDLCFGIHQRYGPGLFENAYQRILVHELKKFGYQVDVQKAIPLLHEDLHVPVAYRADIIVDGCVLIELKSVEALPKVYYKQVVTYLKLTGLKLGILVNFNVNLIKDGIHRIVNNL